MADLNPDTGIKIRQLTPTELSERAAACPCQKKPERIKTALETLKAEGFVPWHALTEFLARKEELIPSVLGFFERTHPDDLERRMQYAGYLARMGVATGLDFIIAHLQSPQQEIRWRALLNWNIEDAPPRTLAETSLLLSLLHDPEKRIRESAIQACGLGRVEGFIPVFEKLLADGTCPARGRVAYWLLSKDASEKHVDLVMDFLNRDATRIDTHWALEELGNLARKPSPALAAKVTTVLEDFFLHSRNEYKYEYGNMRLFGEIGTGRSLPAFQRMAEAGPDAASRGIALEAIARMKPALALELLPACLDRQTISGSFLTAFQTSASESDRSDLIRLVLDALAAKRKDFHFTDAVVDFLLDHGGEAGRSAVAAELPRLDSAVRTHAVWKLNRWTVQDVLQVLKAHGLIETLPDPLLLEQVRQEQALSAPDERLFIEVLRAANILRKLSSEADARDRPPNHCDLLAEFSRATDGLFAPRFCRQTVISRPVADLEFTAKFNQQRSAESLDLLPLEEDFNHVSFVSGNRLFEFETFVSHRYYDIGLTALAVNTALEHASFEKRLVVVEYDGGFHLCFFGKPDQIREFCSAFSIVIAEVPVRSLGGKYTLS